MAQGELRKLSYTPGQAIVRSLPPAEGDYTLVLADIGKRGLAGWKTSKKPGGFPSRMVKFDVLDTEDEATGNAKQVVNFFSLSPKAFDFSVIPFAVAIGYSEPLPEMEPFKGANDPGVRQLANWIDAMLEFAKDNETQVQARITVDVYKGRQQARIGEFLSPDEGFAGEEQDPSNNLEGGGEGGDGESGEAEPAFEEEKPMKPKNSKNSAPKNGKR